MKEYTLSLQKASQALLLIRIAAAAAFLYHGYGIVSNAAGFAGFAHIPAALAWVIGLGELAGGLGMLTGVLARPAAAGLAVIMLGAILMVHLKNGFDITKNGFEYALAQLLICTAVIIAGSGSLAVKLPSQNAKN